jgi:hypothetical protein
MRLTKCYSKDFINREMNIVNFNFNLNFNGSIGRVLAEVRRKARGG